MRQIVLSLMMCAIASPGYSEMLRVRTIELGDATRVAVEFSQRPSWEQLRTEDGVAIRVPTGTVTDLDWAPMFSDQPDNRLDDVIIAEDGSEIVLLLSCECEVEVFEFGDVSLVVDIGEVVSGFDKNSSEFEIFMPDVFPWEGMSQNDRIFWDAAAQTDPDLTGFTAIPMPAPPMPTSLPTISTATFSDPPSMTVNPSSLLLPIETFSEVQRSGFATQTLARELSRAIAQGLVDAPDIGTLPLPNARDQTVPVDLGENRTNITVSTAVDRDTAPARQAGGTTPMGSVCLPDSAFDINAWGDTTDRTVLGRLRAAAFDKNGDVDQAGALALSRYYLALGFGAEARSISTKIANTDMRSIVETLADIVDHGESDSTVLEGQIVCKGKVALWAMIARPVAPSEKPSETEHILSAFSELPLHIRVHLGPVLSERLQELGFLSQAQIALNAVTRAGSQTMAQDLTAARLGLSGTTATSARAELKRLSRGTDLIAAEALLELLLDAERRAVPPAPEWVDDAPSLVRAVQGTDTAEALNLAAMRGRIALGQFDILRSVLGDDSPGMTASNRTRLASAALAAAADSADDPTLLRSELSFSKIADLADIPLENQLTLAARLIGLGLPERGIEYLPTTATSDEARKLRARALADMLRFDEAIAVLSDPPTPSLLTDLGTTLVKDGQVAEATQAFARAAELEAASRAALQAADWNWLQRNADQTLRDASRVLQRDYDVRPVSGNIDLLQSASDTRTQARALMERTKILSQNAPFTN